jgi:Fe-S cluster biogenesis protein NfuA
MSAEPVRITAFEPPPRAELCRFRMSRPVMPGASDAFSSLEEASGHPLFTALLRIPHVHSVGVEHDLIVMAKPDRSVPWEPLMAAAREAITAWFESGLAPEIAVIAEGDVEAESALAVKVRRVIEEIVNPGVAVHGGEVELVEVRGSRIFVRLGGGCQGCSASELTVRNGLTMAVRNAAPEVTDIVDVTDHSAGESPFYSPEDGSGESASPA